MKRNKKLICSTCGSNDIQIKNDGYCICNHCGTKILLDNKSINITNNEINLLVKGGDRNLPFYEIQAKVSPDDFFRETLIDLATKRFTPGNIFDSNFNSVRTVYRKYAKVDVDVDISYTASIGYDKKETYKEKEWVYNKTKEKYEDKMVQKTRIVTEWKPLSSSKSFSYSEGICLDRYNYDVDEEIKSLEHAFPKWVQSQTKKTYNGEKDIPSPQMPSQKQIDDIADSCIDDAVVKCKRTLPGNHYEDFSYSARRSKDVNAYIVPQYVLGYQFENKNCSIRSLAGSEKMTTGAYPDASKDIFSQATKKTLPLFIATFIALPVSILISLIYFFVSLNGITQSAKFFGIVLCLGSCILAVILGKCLQKKREGIANDILTLYHHQKILGLKSLLKKLNLAELSNNEIEQIEGMGEKQ